MVNKIKYPGQKKYTECIHRTVTPSTTLLDRSTSTPFISTYYIPYFHFEIIYFIETISNKIQISKTWTCSIFKYVIVITHFLKQFHFSVLHFLKWFLITHRLVVLYKYMLKCFSGYFFNREQLIAGGAVLREIFFFSSSLSLPLAHNIETGHNTWYVAY